MGHEHMLLVISPLGSMVKSKMAIGISTNYDAGMEQTFSDAFNAHLNRTGMTVTEIARRSGVNKDTLYSVKRGIVRNMNVSDAIRVAAVFDETVEEFMGLSPAQIRDSLAQQIAKLTPREQQILEASITALLAQREDQEETPDATTGATPDPRSIPRTTP